jgi:hypothetical protein
VKTKMTSFHWFLAVSLLVLPFQNCSVYQSPQRKLLEEKGIHFLGTTCEPFISPASLIDLFQVNASTFVEVIPGETSSGRTCRLYIPGAPTEDLGIINCYFNATARSEFTQWLQTAYSGSTRNQPSAWTTPALESGETATDRRFMNLTTLDSQSRPAEGYLRVISTPPDARVSGVGARRTSGAQVVQCAISMRSTDLTRNVPRLQACLNWDVSTGTTPPETISARDQAQCLLEKIVDLFVEQTF